MEQILQVWFDTSVQGVAIVEPFRDGEVAMTAFTCRRVNTAFAAMLGRSQEELIGQPICPLFPLIPEDEFFHLLQTATQTEGSAQLHQYQQQNGVDQWHQLTLTRLGNKIMINVQDVSEQKKAERALARRLSIDSLLSSISSRLITLAGAEVDTYLVEALRLVSDYIGADRASIFLYSADGQRGSCLHEWCAPAIKPYKELIQNVPLTQFAWACRQVENGKLTHIQVDELTPEASEEKRILAESNIQSMTLVPLRQAEQLQGFIGFYALQSSQPWDSNDVSLLETFATLISGVLQRQQQETTIRRANQRLEGLRAIDQALLSKRLAGQSPLRLAMEYIQTMVPCNRITVFEFDEVTGLAVAKSRVMEGKLETQPTYSFPASYIYNPADSENQLIYYPDLQPHTVGVPPELRLYEQGFRSLAIVPLYSQHKYIGAFTLLSVKPFFFTDEYRLIAQELASSLALVLYQQQLDEQLEQYTRQLEERVAERTRENHQLSTLQQAILQHAGQAIISTNIDGVIQTANPACEHILGYKPEELLGRVIHFEEGAGQYPIQFFTHEAADNQTYSPSTRYFDLLITHGYFSCECLALGKQGRQVPVLLSASILRDQTGSILGYVGIATDISALKAADDQLRKANTELNTVFDGAIDLHCITDLAGHFVNTNHAWEAALGYTKEELKSLTIWDLAHPDEVAIGQQTFQVLLSTQVLQNQVNRIRKKDGTYCVLEWNGRLIDQLMYSSARDITGRQQAEDQLRALNERLQLATQAAGQGIWENDLKTGEIFWDEYLWKLHGRKAPENPWTYTDYYQTVHPDDRAAFLENNQIAMQGPTCRLANVYRMVRPDGVVRYLETNGRIIRNSEGQPTRLIGVAWDVTERKKAEEALKESELRFRQIAENVDELFWIKDIQTTKFLYMNPAYEKFSGLRIQDLYENPHNFLAFVVEQDRHLILEVAKSTAPSGTIRFRVRHQDGRIHWLSARRFGIQNESGVLTHLIGVATDITSTVENEQILQASLTKERTLTALQSQFITTASHEFRTPLAVICSSVELVQHYLKKVPDNSFMPFILRHLTTIFDKVQSLDELIGDTLAISKLDEGKVKVKLEETELVAFCNTLIKNTFNDRADHRKVIVTGTETPVTTLVDKKLLSHVLSNLLSNAFKFSSTNPDLIIRHDKATITLTVRDQGIGIPADQLSHLFGKFFRARNAVDFQGTGLGLVICQEYIRLLKGRLDVESEEGIGSTFTITLPRS